MQKVTSFMLFIAVLGLTSNAVWAEVFDEDGIELGPAFGGIKTMDELLEALAHEKDRHGPRSLKHECSGNHYYGCNPRQPGEFGLIAPCCSDICCHDGEDLFGTCRPTRPCLT